MPTGDEFDLIGPPKTDREDEADVVVNRGKKKPRGDSRRQDDDNDDDDNDANSDAADSDDEPTRQGEGSESEEDVSKDAYQLFLAFQKNRALYVDDVHAKLRELYEAYATGAEFTYSKKNFLPQIMTWLRKVVNNDALSDDGGWNLVFLQRTGGVEGSVKDFKSFTMSTTLSMRQRLTDEQNILLFSFNDLVCLSYILRASRKTLGQTKVSNNDTSRTAVEKQIRIIESTQMKIIDRLRALDGSMAALKQAGLLFAGEPLALAVEKHEKLISGAVRPSDDRGYVAIYFDFDKTRLYNVNARDVDVPSAAQLDVAYEAMRTDPRKLILLDLRNTYKRRRGWMQ